MNDLQLRYLIYDVVLLHLDIINIEHFVFSIEEDNICVYNEGKCVYYESIFCFENIILKEDDLKFLDYLHSNYSNIDFEKLYVGNFLKLIFFFTNEKYLYPNVKDKHSRVSNDSIDITFLKYLEIPITDILINFFINSVKIDVKRSFKFSLTCDYDILNFWKGISTRNSLSILFNYLLERKFKLFYYQILSFVFSSKISKYNYYLNKEMYLDSLNSTEKHQIENIAFLLIDYTNKKYDFNNRLNSIILCFVKNLKQSGVKIGLHPSYNSSGNTELFKNQCNVFLNKFGSKIDRVRYHYLRINYEDDLQILKNHKILYDYSFAFADSLLFRGGITKRFKLWDYKSKEPYDVILVPLTIMDGTLFDYLDYSRDSDFYSVRNKLELSYKFGFEITTLIHNNGMTKMATKKDISFNLNNLILQFIQEKIDSENVN